MAKTTLLLAPGSCTPPGHHNLYWNEGRGCPDSLGRLGQPDDIASVAVFLASDDSRWLTGVR